MKRILTTLMLCILTSLSIMAQDPSAVQRYQREAESYQRQAESYARDAKSYLRQARSYENDAASYLRNGKYDTARDYYRRAANAMDNYQSKMNSARSAASNAEDYLQRAANALRD